MPLVVPGLTTKTSATGNPQAAEWTNKLVGKKLSEDGHSETVSSRLFNGPVQRDLDSSDHRDSANFKFQNFCKKDLPEKTRVIEPGMMVTKDFHPDRLNIHLKEDGTVSHVQHG